MVEIDAAEWTEDFPWRGDGADFEWRDGGDGSWQADVETFATGANGHARLELTVWPGETLSAGHRWHLRGQRESLPEYSASGTAGTPSGAVAEAERRARAVWSQMWEA